MQSLKVYRYVSFTFPVPSHLAPSLRVRGGTPVKFMEKHYGSWN